MQMTSVFRNPLVQRFEQNMDEQRPTAANAIELRVEKIAQLFHSLDPFPFREKDLDNDVEEFIVGWARELPPDKPLGIVIHLPETEASTSENSVQLSLNILTVAPESLRSILTSS